MSASNGCGLCKVAVNNLSVIRDNERLLDNLSFELHCGELTAIIGVNGAGKTTLVRSILGEIEHEGTVGFESHDGKKLSNITIGYVPQHLKFDTSSPISVSDFLMAARTTKSVAFFGSKKDKYSIKESLEAAGASELLNRTLGDLSGGELQRVMLAQALFPTPELLILDEPLSGVDCVGSEQFYDSITKLRKNYHISVAMVSHDLELVKQYADNVLLINKKLLCSGNVFDVFNSDEYKKTFQVGGGIK